MLGNLSDRNLIDRMIKKKNNKSLFFRISILVSQILFGTSKSKNQTTNNAQLGTKWFLPKIRWHFTAWHVEEFISSCWVLRVEDYWWCPKTVLTFDIRNEEWGSESQDIFFFVQDKIFFFNSTIACWKIHIRKSFVTLETLPLKTKASLASHLWKLEKNIHFHKSLIKTRFYSTTLVSALKIFWFEMPFVCAVTKAVWGTINKLLSIILHLTVPQNVKPQCVLCKGRTPMKVVCSLFLLSWPFEIKLF